MAKNVTITFEYKYYAFASIQPKILNRKAEKRMKEKERLGRMFQPDYPDFPSGIVVSTKIKDLRPFGIPLSGEYSGNIDIRLTRVKAGGYIVVGSLDHRKNLAQQYIYRYRRGRKYDDVWMGMPEGHFDVQIRLTMPDDHYDAVLETERMLNRVTREEAGALEVERTVGWLRAMTEFRAGHHDVEDVVKQGLDDEKLEQQSKIMDWLEKSIGGPGLLEEGMKDLEKLEDEDSAEYKELTSIVANGIKEEDLRRRWARALGDLDQEILEETREVGKKKKERKARRRARRDLKTMKQSDRVLDDIFDIFRFYFNTYILSVKYLLGQYWMEPIPSWASDTFYEDNKVQLDDMVLVRRPVYSVGALVRQPPTDNITPEKWKTVANLSFGQMMALATGFTAEGIFTKAYEGLWDNEAEVCILLVDIGLEFAFMALRMGLSPEQKQVADQLGVPDLDAEAVCPASMNKCTRLHVSFGEAIKSSRKLLEEKGPELGFSRSKVMGLWKELEYIHVLRNAIAHRKTIITNDLYRAIEGDGSELDHTRYGMKLEKDPKGMRYRKPLWWRVLSELWHASQEIRLLLTLFRTRYLS